MNKIKQLEETVEGLKIKIQVLENELEEMASYYSLAKAVCEIQDELKKLNPSLMLYNKIYAPTKVGTN